ncbi:MAG: EpsG family protein [Methylophilaceae bacterium]|nr:EpsG family protein [Methylophilaceae bacterium]
MKTTRIYTLSQFITSTIVIGLLLLLIDAETLPDYEAYETIYLTRGLGGDWEILFVAYSFIMNTFGFDYNEFRFSLILISTFSLSTIIYKLSNKGVLGPRSSLGLLGVGLLVPILWMFCLEYFNIRIRAGFALSLFSVAFCFISPITFTRLIFCISLISCSYFIHGKTTIILMFYAVIPFIWYQFNRNRKIRYYNYIIACFLSSFAILYLILMLSPDRGEHMIGELNVFRFLLVALIPLLLAAVKINESSFIKRSPQFNINFLHEFPKLFIDLYLTFCVSLSVFYFLGFANESGEAIVRVITLASVPALYCIVLRGGVFAAPISFWIMFSNAAFFFATLYL